MRKRQDRDIPIVAAKRAKLSEVKTGRRVSCPAYGMPSYMPQEQVSEDIESIKQHKLIMNTELKKRNPDNRKIDTSMCATFNDRRKLIVEEGASLNAMKEQYKALFDAQQVNFVNYN